MAPFSKMRNLIRQYGLPFFIFETAVWACTGLGMYYLVDSGQLGGADAITLLRKLHVDQVVSLDDINPSTGNAALAFALNELLVQNLRLDRVTVDVAVFDRNQSGYLWSLRPRRVCLG
eukprot:TRINITY_DN6660_c0_g1_i2.p1 TRINITY_DN6660_c0_g1~~TRINITY_DN6660_c0_g1_i2.p1  ORF type:complete len:118 (+),score=15.40 TRINITY_DN6660_c0_g1_i2:313-666(+)